MPLKQKHMHDCISIWTTESAVSCVFIFILFLAVFYSCFVLYKNEGGGLTNPQSHSLVQLVDRRPHHRRPRVVGSTLDFQTHACTSGRLQAPARRGPQHVPAIFRPIGPPPL